MTEHCQELLKSVFGGRRWIVATDVLAGSVAYVEALEALGAERCLCIATSAGAGPGPNPDFAPNPIVVPVTAPDMMAGIRRSLDALADLPKEAVEGVDAFDPAREVRVLGTIFDDGRPVAGREKYGARPQEWQQLEDKTRIDALWTDAGIAHAPFRIVPAEPAALASAHDELNRGGGCAWAGDNKEGFNGGATYLRWVQSAEDATSAAGFFADHCDRVRVMPFLEGIPCSIHGFVFPEYIVTLRPCEMLVFRQPGRSTLQYGRAASFWDPPSADREAMRDAARRAGEYLRDRYRYRGAFTIDGVLSEDGFLPTELNPRFGAALGIMTAKLDLPLLLLNAAIVERQDLDFQPRQLEQHLLSCADAERAGGGMAMVKKRPKDPQKASLVWRSGQFQVDDTASEPDATAMLGPVAAGGFVKVDLNSSTTPVGPSAAPRVAAALACLDAYWDLGIGPLEPARDVRGSD